MLPRELITSQGQKVRESVTAVTHLDCAWILGARETERKRDKKERKMRRLAVKRLDNDTENQT